MASFSFAVLLHTKVQYLFPCRYERRFSELNVCIQVRMVNLIFTLLLYRFVSWLKMKLASLLIDEPLCSTGEASTN